MMAIIGLEMMEIPIFNCYKKIMVIINKERFKPFHQIRLYILSVLINLGIKIRNREKISNSPLVVLISRKI